MAFAQFVAWNLFQALFRRLDERERQRGRVRFVADDSSRRLGAMIDEALTRGAPASDRGDDHGILEVGDFVYTPFPPHWARSRSSDHGARDEAE